MKKIISFEKEINFTSMIGEITSIALDHTLKFVDSNSVRGNFIISGSYKMTEASTLEEKFSYEIPTEIDLVEKLDLSTSNISIDDFTYEIINDDILMCHIDVLVEGVEEVILEEDKEDDEKIEEEEVEVLSVRSERECDGDTKEEKEIEIPIKEENNEVVEEKEDIKDDNDDIEVEDLLKDNIEIKRENKGINDMLENEENSNSAMIDSNSTNIGSLFEAFNSTEETFTTYSVYIFRKEDTLDKVLNQYKITRDMLSEYNDLDHIEIGSKLIIPSTNE